MCQSKAMLHISHAHSIQSVLTVPVKTASESAMNQEDNSLNHQILVQG